MALLILALLQRIFLMSSLMLLLVWLIFFMVLIKLLPILGTISGKTVKLMVLALICLEITVRIDTLPIVCFHASKSWRLFYGSFLLPLDRKSGSAGMPRPISYAVFCLKKKKIDKIARNKKEVTQMSNQITDSIYLRKSAS